MVLFFFCAAGGRHVGAFGGGEEAEEFGFDDAGVVAGLDGEDALDDDLFDEEFFFGADGEFVEEGAADDVGPDGAVEGTEEGDLEGVGDAGGLVAAAAAARGFFSGGGGSGGSHVFEHTDLADEGGGKAEGGAVLAHELEHFLAVVVAFFDGGEFDRHDLFDHGGVGPVDRKLEAFFEEGILGGFDGILEREDAVAPGDFGELDNLFDDVGGVDGFVEEAFLEVGGHVFGGMPGHGHDGEAGSAAHHEDEAFGGVEGAEFPFSAVVHGEDDSAGSEQETDDGGDVHKFAILALGKRVCLHRGLSVRGGSGLRWGIQSGGISEFRMRGRRGDWATSSLAGGMGQGDKVTRRLFWRCWDIGVGGG
jgi:hypothetical protein